MSKITSIRLPDQLIHQLKEIAERENIEYSVVVRKFLTESAKNWKTKKVLERLNSHEISIGQAAELLGVSLWDMMDLVKKHNIDWTGYDEEDLERTLSILKS